MPVREINVGDLVSKVLEKAGELLPDTATNLANLLADKAHELWVLEAKTTPTKKDGTASGWGERYASTIKTDYATSSGVAKVFVDENDKNYKYVEHVEEGVEQWNISKALLKGKAARRNQALYGNVFVVVPFRYRVPGKTKPTSSAFAGIMPKDVYDMAKSGEKIGKEYGHLAGLKKMSGGVHTQYMTFRTVTENTPEWIYPRKPAQPVFEMVQKKVDKMVEGAIVNFVQGFLKDIKKESEKE